MLTISLPVVTDADQQLLEPVQERNIDPTELSEESDSEYECDSHYQTQLLSMPFFTPNAECIIDRGSASVDPPNTIRKTPRRTN